MQHEHYTHGHQKSLTVYFKKFMLKNFCSGTYDCYDEFSTAIYTSVRINAFYPRSSANFILFRFSARDPDRPHDFAVTVADKHTTG